MALVRPSTPDNPGAHYIYETDEEGIPGLMVDFEFFPLERLRSLVYVALQCKTKLPWSDYVNKVITKWIIAQIKC